MAAAFNLETNEFLANSVPALISYVDREGRYRFINHAYTSWFGFDPALVIGQKAQDILRPETYARLKESIDQALQGRIVKTMISVNHLQNGKRLLEVTYTPDMGPDGFVRGVSVLGVDITELQAIERLDRYLSAMTSFLNSSLDEVQILQDFVKFMTSHLTDWCFAFTLSSRGTPGDLVVSNPDLHRAKKMKEILKRGPFRLSEKLPWHSVLRTGQSQTIARMSDEVLQTWVKDELCFEALSEFRFNSFMTLPLKVGGQVIGAVVLATDQRGRDLNAADLEIFEQLTARVAVSIQNAKLFAQVEFLNKAKDHLMAMLSHEMRSPLTVMKGYTELLMEDAEVRDSKNLSACAQAIHRSAQIQTRIVGDLFDMSALIMGKFSIQAAVIDAPSILLQILTTLRKLAEEKGLSFVFDISALPAMIYADPVRFQQIVWNLVSNAVKFTPSGGKIEVQIIRSVEGIKIEVKDSGMGISAEHLQDVFKLFYQEADKGPKVSSGLGLGLSIVRQLVEAHGWSVDATSEGVNKGSRFTVIIPEMALQSPPAKMH